MLHILFLKAYLLLMPVILFFPQIRKVLCMK
nr:MAG TPA: hypothetical protein [Bacteriophage sp.]